MSSIQYIEKRGGVGKMAIISDREVKVMFSRARVSLFVHGGGRGS